MCKETVPLLSLIGDEHSIAPTASIVPNLSASALGYTSILHSSIVRC